ncbi:hypothetical protein VTP01DRAFT_4708 [Rhizomucor pusillus]|uniref:uncharacterized protein n=1 Tax=Rhizomucor pusillus TaxID=4840 RepID=UPI0037441DB3
MVAAARKARSPLSSFVTKVVEKPHVFFSTDEKVADQALAVAKHFYDTAKQHQEHEFSPFPELLVEGFDRDQIWEEIAAQNGPFLQYAKSIVSNFSRKRKRSEMMQDDSEAEEEEGSVTSEGSLDLDAEDDQIEEEHLDPTAESADEDDVEAYENESEQDVEEQYSEDEEQKEGQQEDEDENEDEDEDKSAMLRSEVDDEFFNLEEFNKWTEKQEELDMMSDREDEDDEVDYDMDLMEVEDEDEENDDLQDAADITFKDFFVAPKSKKAKKAKKVSFAQEDEGEDDEEADSNVEEDEMEMEDEATVKTSNLFDEDEDGNDDSATQHEKRMERLKAQIEQFEQENINEKHWTLRGEINAKARPVNSLLEEDLEFDQSVKPVPVITQETTSALEEMIKKRILDNQFDDVERKADPTAKPFLPSKRVEISDEKSQKSLAELYEEEYIKQKTNDQTNEKDEALKKEHGAITEMFNTLCQKLDALSNFHFTPKAPKPEVTIVTDAPAISMEEVLPVNVSDATLLAPEEVYDKKRGELKSKSEMTQEEKKRERARKKKEKRKEKALKEREAKLLAKTNPGLGNKHAKMKAVKELLGQKNVEVIKSK